MTTGRTTRAAPRPVPVVPGRLSLRVAAGALVVGGLLTAAAYAGRPAMLAAVLLCCGLLAAGWARLLDLPSPRGTTTVVILGGALAAVAVALTTDEPLLEWLSPALAAAVIGEFIHQLARWDGRPRMVESVCGSIAGVAVLGSLAAVVALPESPLGAHGVMVWALPVALAVALQALPLPGRIAVPLAVVVAALAGSLLGGLLPGPTGPATAQAIGQATVLAAPLAAALAAAAAAAVAVMLHRLLLVLPRVGTTPGWLALATAPLASSGLVGYVVLRALAA